MRRTRQLRDQRRHRRCLHERIEADQANAKLIEAEAISRRLALPRRLTLPRLLALPPELRNLIWYYAVSTTGTITIPLQVPLPRPEDLDHFEAPLLRTCRQIRQETRRLYFASTKFSLSYNFHHAQEAHLRLRQWLKNIGPAACAAIQSEGIIMQITGRRRDWCRRDPGLLLPGEGSLIKTVFSHPLAPTAIYVRASTCTKKHPALKLANEFVTDCINARLQPVLAVWALARDDEAPRVIVWIMHAVVTLEMIEIRPQQDECMFAVVCFIAAILHLLLSLAILLVILPWHTLCFWKGLIALWTYRSPRTVSQRW